LLNKRFPAGAFYDLRETFYIDIINVIVESVNKYKKNINFEAGKNKTQNIKLYFNFFYSHFKQYSSVDNSFLCFLSFWSCKICK